MKRAMIFLLAIAVFSLAISEVLAFPKVSAEEKELDSAINEIDGYIQSSRKLSNIYGEFLLHAKAAGSEELVDLCEGALSIIAKSRKLSLAYLRDIRINRKNYEKIYQEWEEEINEFNMELVFLKAEISYLVRECFVFYYSPFKNHKKNIIGGKR